jgi:hypothetical protein
MLVLWNSAAGSGGSPARRDEQAEARPRQPAGLLRRIVLMDLDDVDDDDAPDDRVDATEIEMHGFTVVERR